jgi:aerobic carbon-monoxide dehydrogenase medium subunit
VKLPPFTLHRPGSVAQASRLLTELGDDAAAYCGGTELLLAMKLGLASYEHLIDLKRVTGLRGVHAGDDGMLRVGAATTHNELETDTALLARYPELPAMISQVANVRVRSVGTLGGNLCFADPHSDPAPFLIALGATMVCQLGDATRRVPAGRFLAGPYQTVLDPGELLACVELPPRPASTGLAHLRMKLTERPAVTATAMITLTGGPLSRRAVSAARLVVGSVGRVPFAADAVGLTGATDQDFAERAQDCAARAAAGCAPLQGTGASPDYLRHLAFVHARQALTQAFSAAARTTVTP